MRRHKYKVAPAKDRRFNGRTYASKAEMLYAKHLFAMRESALILEFTEQPTVRLGVPENVYRPDFLVIPDEGYPFYVDVKGVETRTFKRNKKLWSAYGWLDLHVVKRFGKKFLTTEVVHGQYSSEGHHGQDI